MEGESEVEYVVVTAGDEPVSFAAFERVAAKIGDREGTFVPAPPPVACPLRLGMWRPAQARAISSSFGEEGDYTPKENRIVPFTLRYDVCKLRQTRAA